MDCRIGTVNTCLLCISSKYWFFHVFFRILYLTECTMITYLTFRVLVFWLLTFFSKFIQSGRLKINVSLRNKNKICVYLDTYDHMDNALSIHTVWIIIKLSRPFNTAKSHCTTNFSKVLQCHLCRTAGSMVHCDLLRWGYRDAVLPIHLSLII